MIVRPDADAFSRSTGFVIHSPGNVGQLTSRYRVSRKLCYLACHSQESVNLAADGPVHPPEEGHLLWVIASDR